MKGREFGLKWVVVFLTLFLWTGISWAGDTWYSGGTLHKKTIHQWNNASYENRLATSADFVVSVTQENKQDELFLNNATLLERKAIALEICITTTTAVKEAEQEINSLSVAEIASSCILLLGLNK